MADHPDYLPGELPAIHSPTHADGGVDELNLAGLGGVTQELAIHAALPTVHQDAPALIGVHAAIAAAHHVKYTDGEARASIDNIFGSDGKADVDINLDGHDLKGGSVILPNGKYIGIGAALERLEFYTAGYAAFIGCKVGIGTVTPFSSLHQAGVGDTYYGDARFGGLNADFGVEIKYDQAGATEGTIYASPGYSNASILLKLGAGSDNPNQLVLKGNGNIGINEANPTTGKLVVNGSLDISAHNYATIGLKLGGTLVKASADEINFLEEVSYGIDDSGGAGFKVLRVPN